jgi:hypothetical protein
VCMLCRHMCFCMCHNICSMKSNLVLKMIFDNEKNVILFAFSCYMRLITNMTSYLTEGLFEEFKIYDTLGRNSLFSSLAE